MLVSIINTSDSQTLGFCDMESPPRLGETVYRDMADGSIISGVVHRVEWQFGDLWSFIGARVYIHNGVIEPPC